MPIGIRMQDLRKVYTSPPPMAAAGGMFSGPRKKKTGKKFEVTALDGVTLEIHPGEIFGLLGPNGAGKSTAVGILTTRIRPTSGEAWVGEHEVWREQVQAKRLIGVVQQRPNLDFALTAREILEFHAAYFGVATPIAAERWCRRLRLRPRPRARSYATSTSPSRVWKTCFCTIREEA